MAKKTRQGQKQCPKCKAWVKGTRTKACPKCNRQFNGKQTKTPAPKPVVAEKKSPNGVVEKPVKAVNTVTVEQVRAVTQTVQVVGGIPRLNELLSLVKEVGGLRKMKELLDAMTAPEDDVIKF